MVYSQWGPNEFYLDVINGVAKTGDIVTILYEYVFCFIMLSRCLLKVLGCSKHVNEEGFRLQFSFATVSKKLKSHRDAIGIYHQNNPFETSAGDMNRLRRIV